MPEPLTGHFYAAQPVTEAAERAKQYLPAASNAANPWDAIAGNRNDSIAALGGFHSALTLYDTEIVKLRNQHSESIEQKNKIQRKYSNIKLYGGFVGLPALAIISGLLLRAIWPFRASSTQS